MQFKLTRDLLVGSTIQSKGDIVQADGKYAEALVRSGAAVPVAPSVETATVDPKGERATSPRQR
jgi:hypothetical protein